MMTGRKNNDGPGLTEIILALIVMIVLVFIFRGHLVAMFSSMIRRISVWQ